MNSVCTVYAHSDVFVRMYHRLTGIQSPLYQLTPLKKHLHPLTTERPYCVAKVKMHHLLEYHFQRSVTL